MLSSDVCVIFPDHDQLVKSGQEIPNFLIGPLFKRKQVGGGLLFLPISVVLCEELRAQLLEVVNETSL